MSIAPPLSLYVIPEKALRRWAGERLCREAGADGRTVWRFAMSGSTCGNVPIEVAMTVVTGADGRIESATARPVAGDTGCGAMCGAVAAASCNGREFLHEFGNCDDVVGLTLHDAAFRDWHPEPSGCFCTPGHRRHKWRSVFQTIHFAATREASGETSRETPGSDGAAR